MQSFSWIFIYAFALPIFFGLLFLLYKFMDFKLRSDQEELAPIFETSDNVVGLSQEELAHKKTEQKAAMKHLSEVIAKVPVEMKDGKFTPMSGDALKAELARREKTMDAPELVQLDIPKELATKG
jgi:hypothetical protein